MSDWRIPMGAANLIVRDVTLEQAVERAEKWRGLMAYQGELVPIPENSSRPAGSTPRVDGPEAEG